MASAPGLMWGLGAEGPWVLVVAQLVVGAWPARGQPAGPQVLEGGPAEDAELNSMVPESKGPAGMAPVTPAVLLALGLAAGLPAGPRMLVASLPAAGHAAAPAAAETSLCGVRRRPGISALS